MPSGTYRLFRAGDLRLPPDRDEADPFRLHSQIEAYGYDIRTVPAVVLTQGADGEYMINDGVTRATRAYLGDPMAMIPGEIIAVFQDMDLTSLRRIRDVVD